mmetsp:Transcript_21183/g.50117  ORF Transcript_21183/g.50117 Transcript_21183/m.50117 type:complete len:162 (+) Transcript_21183:39-524(+)
MNVLSLYRKCAPYPMGKQAFSLMFCMKAPYFWSIRPLVEDLKPGRAVVSMRHRRMTCNHIGTQHAIACCNLVEMAMGCVVEASLPKHLRWLPRGMEVEYKAKAVGTLTATTEIDPETHFNLDKYPGDVDIPVTVRDPKGTEVVGALVKLYISEKPKKDGKL